jgi:tRNA-binding protein
MKYICIDYGSKRVGIAVSDDSGAMGFPKGEYPNNDKLLDEVATIIQSEKIEGIVMGESRNLDGSDNTIMEEARAFAEALSKLSGKPLFYEPEMFSTQEARRDIEGVRGHGAVDAKAASIILTTFLERQKNMPQPIVEEKKISIDDLMKIEVSIGTVLSAEKVEGSEKLLKCSIDFGEESGPRQILSGIQKYVPEPETLVGKQLAYVTNLAPRKIMGMESNGMLFAVGEGETFAFLSPSSPVPPGTKAH